MGVLLLNCKLVNAQWVPEMESFLSQKCTAILKHFISHHTIHLPRSLSSTLIGSNSLGFRLKPPEKTLGRNARD